MNHDIHRQTHLTDLALWALESTSFGHHPRAAADVAAAVSHLDLSTGRTEAIALASTALGEFTPLADEASSVAVAVIDRMALDAQVVSLRAA